MSAKRSGTQTTEMLEIFAKIFRHKNDISSTDLLADIQINSPGPLSEVLWQY